MLNIAVFFGGFNSEREVSLNSGRNIALSLDKSRYNVFPLELTKDRNWKETSLELLQDHDLIASGFLTESQMSQIHNTFVSFSDLSFWLKNNKIDLVFLALHGGWGENGGVQSLLDLYEVPYTGSNALSSAICMDKVKTQEIVSIHNIKTPKTIVANFEFNSTESITEVIRSKLPLFAKPNSGGSSQGNRLIQELTDLEGLEGEYLLQEVIKGRELTVPVLGESALPVIEIISENNFNYFDKYLSSQTREICPADLIPEMSKEIQRQAIIAHKALGCRGLSRSDFMLTQDGSIIYLETNTTPGCTASSLCPKAAKALGWSMPKFLDKQIEYILYPSNSTYPTTIKNKNLF